MIGLITPEFRNSICSENEFFSSDYGKKKLSDLQKLADLAGVNVNLYDATMKNLQSVYLKNVDIPETYIYNCYEKLLDWATEKQIYFYSQNVIVKTKVPVPLQPIIDAFENLKKGVARFLDYLIVGLVVIGIFLGIYLITDLMKTYKS